MALPIEDRQTSKRSARRSIVHSRQDAFAVADPLVEDAAAGAGLSRATAPLVAEALGLG